MHFNLDTMTAYRKNLAKRGYNPFDYPEEWEFFKHPFEVDEEDDILTDLLFQIRKMTRRLHIYFDAQEYNRLETAFYFGLLDSLSEADDYLLGALKYARYCRLENLFFLAAKDDLGAFFEKLDSLMDELLSKIRSFGESIVNLNEECHNNSLFVNQYCDLTQHGIPDDMLQALLRAPGFQFLMEKTLKIDEKTSFLSYFENIRVGKMYKEYEKFIEGAYDSSKLNSLLEPVDWLFYFIRGTLLWVAIKKVMAIFSSTNALRNRHNKLVETMFQKAYKEVCDVYARSKAYAKRRDEELPQQCGQEMFLQGRKPTAVEIRTYFIDHYRNYILMHNQMQQLFIKNREQDNTFCEEFLNMLLNKETRQDVEDFLFCHTFSRELHNLHTSATNIHKDVSVGEDKDQCQLAHDKYRNHYLMKYANKKSIDRLFQLLEDLEKFQVERGNSNQDTDKYVFDLNTYKKNQIFDVCKEIRNCLCIGKKQFGIYLLENTNLGKNAHSKGKTVTLETILNQL